jgi:peptidyl-prolyl cis-trans isomerase A (cyclophilin A)
MRSKILLLIILFICLAGAGLYFGNEYRKISDLHSKLEEAIGTDAGYVETILKLESESSSVTYLELLDLCAKSIEQRTGLIIELRGLYPGIESTLKEELLVYLNEENELIRQKAAFYRKRLSLSSSVESFEEHISDPPTSSYGWERYFKRFAKLTSDIAQASQEMSDIATNFSLTYERLAKQESQIETSMETQGVRFISVFQKYQEGNLSLVEDVKTWVQSVRSQNEAHMNSIALFYPNGERMNQQAPDVFKVEFKTGMGDFVVEVTRDLAPMGADRFYNLVNAGFYTECRFFRVIPKFMAQFGYHGAPQITAIWIDATIPDDPVKASNERGTITFATRGPNTRTTQLFINFDNNSYLDEQGFAPLGQVVEGMDVVDSLYSGYGEQPNQQDLGMRGNEYLNTQFPLLDYIKLARTVD